MPQIPCVPTARNARLVPTRRLRPQTQEKNVRKTRETSQVLQKTGEGQQTSNKRPSSHQQQSQLAMEARRQQRLQLQHLMLRLAIHRARAMYRRQRAPPLPVPPALVAPMAHQAPPRRRRRRPTIPRVRLTTLGLTATQILTTYRLDMHTIQDILADIQIELTPDIRCATAIPPLLKLLSVLHFLATGSYQHTTSMLHGLAQPTFSGILTQVMSAMRQRVQQHIYMPRTPAEVTAMKAMFYGMHHFPQVIGCIDCTHIALVPPRAHEQAYRNRKMQHTLNVQMTCDANLCFQEVCARFPGSAHDARILRASTLHTHMEHHVPARTILLGDSGYPLLPWLMTPVRNPQTPAERRYNYAHIHTRNTVERAFGLLKCRFRCLDRTGGALMYRPEKVGQIIITCAMLHNIAVRRRVPMPELPIPVVADDDDDDDGGQQPAPPPGHANDGRAARNAIIDGYFT